MLYREVIGALGTANSAQVAMAERGGSAGAAQARALSRRADVTERRGELTMPTPITPLLKP